LEEFTLVVELILKKATGFAGDKLKDAVAGLEQEVISLFRTFHF
jgi:hypothetical protein